MAVLTLEQILSSDDTKPREVHVPEWGGSVNVYPLTCKQIEEMEAWQDDNPAMLGFRLKVLQFALRDLSLDDDALRELDKKNGAVIKRLANIAAELCQPKHEELEGN